MTTEQSAQPAPTLKDVLERASPPDDEGRRNIVSLSKALGVSFQSVYRWVNNNRITPKNAVRVTEISNGAVSIDEFTPFYFSR